MEPHFRSPENVITHYTDWTWNRIFQIVDVKVFNPYMRGIHDVRVKYCQSQSEKRYINLNLFQQNHIWLYGGYSIQGLKIPVFDEHFLNLTHTKSRYGIFTAAKTRPVLGSCVFSFARSEGPNARKSNVTEHPGSTPWQAAPFCTWNNIVKSIFKEIWAWFTQLCRHPQLAQPQNNWRVICFCSFWHWCNRFRETDVDFTLGWTQNPALTIGPNFE